MTSVLCTYALKAGCKECSEIVYTKCPKYVKCRMYDLLSELKPLDFTWDRTYKPYKHSKIIQLKGTIKKSTISLLKSAAVNWAIENNSKIIRLDTEKVLARVLKNSETKDVVQNPIIPCRGYFLDITRMRFSQKDDEIRSCVNCFVSLAEDAGCQIFILDRYMIDETSWFTIKE